VMLPNLLVVGAPKAGTTSLHNYFRHHPQIYTPSVKSHHYFSHECLGKRVNGPGDLNAISSICRSLEDYKKRFEGSPLSARIISDHSPSYLYFADHCIQKIKHTLETNVKVIILIRNPVKRAFSNYMHLFNSGREKLSFWDALQAEEQRERDAWSDFWMYKRHSLYSEKIQRYLEAFGELRVKVIIQEELAADGAAIMRGVFEFLGVSSIADSEIFTTIHNKGGAHKNSLAKIVDESDWVIPAVKLILPRSTQQKLREMKSRYTSSKKIQPKQIDEKSSEFLQQYFEEDIKKVERLQSLDLSSWK
jgi:hypothetical protein